MEICELTGTQTNGDEFHRWAIRAREFLGYLILPNVVFLIVGQFGYMTRPVFNLDYLLLGAVAGFLGPMLGTGVYAVLVAVDGFVSLAPVFHFRLDTAVFSMPYVLQLGWRVALLALISGTGVA